MKENLTAKDTTATVLDKLRNLQHSNLSNLDDVEKALATLIIRLEGDRTDEEDEKGKCMSDGLLNYIVDNEYDVQSIIGRIYRQVNKLTELL